MAGAFGTPGTMKLFCCDLNWARYDTPAPRTLPAMAADWAEVDPREYFDWHVEFGNNLMFCQAYLVGGTALYPSRLGPVAPGKGSELLPRLYELSRAAGMPFMSYFCVGADNTVSAHRSDWVVLTGRPNERARHLAPETAWTELLCARIAEFLSAYPVEWLLLDWFVYGDLRPDEFVVQPAWFVKEQFLEIIGREMPDEAAGITSEENLKYKREVLARQFRAIQEAVRSTSPGTQIMFNVPYWKPNEAVWSDQPMMNDSDGLFAECSQEDFVE